MRFDVLHLTGVNSAATNHDIILSPSLSNIGLYSINKFLGLRRIAMCKITQYLRVIKLD